MKKKIRINPATGLAYIPNDLVKSGYVGDVDIIIHAVTATIIKPGTDLSLVKRSLEIAILDIDLQIQQGEK
jgi:hypothetical protein